MKLNLDTSNLDWEKATVKDYRYIHHLMLMIHERWTKLGMTSAGFTSYPRTPAFVSSSIGIAFKMNRYSPNGFLTWDQLSSIYHAMIYLASCVYMNPNNLNERFWVNGNNTKWIFHSLEDINSIAGFDFSTHPFIPGQPIEYYSQFLLPIKKVLASFNKIPISNVIKLSPTHDNSIRLTYNTSVFPLPTKTVTDEDGHDRIWDYQGEDLIDYISDASKWKEASIHYYNQLKNEPTTVTAYHSGKNISRTSLPKSINDSRFLGYEYIVTTLYAPYNNYRQWEKSKVAEGLIIDGLWTSYGNWYKVKSPFPQGCPYDVYLYHLTYSDIILQGVVQSSVPHISKFNSPWPMLIHTKSGVVDSSNEVTEYLELPNFNIPISTSNSIKGKYYYHKFEEADNDIGYIDAGWKEWPQTEEHFSALYAPLFVFDVSSQFEYN